MVKKNRQKDENVVHVRIDSPLQARKAVLGAAISITNMIKVRDDLKSIRNKKAQVLGDLEAEVAKINSLFKHLRYASLPGLPAEEEKPVVKHLETVHKSVVKKEIYDNPTVMENRYLYGLLFSQAFWINHHFSIIKTSCSRKFSRSSVTPCHSKV